MIFRYFKSVLKRWTSYIFLILDAIGAITLAFHINLPISNLKIFNLTFSNLEITPKIFFIAGVCLFFIANVQLYSEMEKQIGELDRNGAHIKLIPQKSELYFHTEEQDGADSYKSIDPEGFPRYSFFSIPMEIHNLGNEDGELDWDIDFMHSKLPFPFLFHKVEKGHFRDFSGRISGRNRADGIFYLPIKIDRSKKIEDFAKAFHFTKKYKLSIKYKTKKIGGVGNTQKIVLTGDTIQYRDGLVKIWKQQDLNNLTDLIKNNQTE